MDNVKIIKAALSGDFSEFSSTELTDAMQELKIAKLAAPATTVPVDRNLAKFDEAKRSLARLMAMENISVQFLEDAKTAWFDTVDRVLVLPEWDFPDINMLDTLIGHEVGHALKTDHTFIEKQVKRIQATGVRDGMVGYWNVIEDTRIERLMRECYPGMKRVFHDGYEGFTKFGPFFKKVDNDTLLMPSPDGKNVPTPTKISELPFIDRINLFYKVGAFYDIPFTADELKWFPQIDACYSTENAWEIAEKLYELEKKNLNAQPQQPQTGQPGQQTMQGGQPQQGQSSQQSGQSEGAEGAEGNEDGKLAPKSSKKSGAKQSGKKTGKGANAKDVDADAEDADNAGSGGELGDEDSDESGADAAGDEDGDEEKDGKGKGKGTGDEKAEGDEDEDEESEDNACSNQQFDGSAQKKDAPKKKEPKSRTDDAINKSLQKLVEQNQHAVSHTIKHLLMKPLRAEEVKARTLPALEWTARAEAAIKNAGVPNYEDNMKAMVAKWEAKFKPTANHMASEFIRRRTARQLTHARIGRTGKLDVNKLYKHKIAEDLFKRTMIVPQGQSHGIVAMIDGSGSMQGVFPNVIDQVLLFAYFAFQCNIPFEAYMFSDSTQSPDKSLSVPKMGLQTITPPDNGRLIGLIDTNTARGAFRKQVRTMLAFKTAFDSTDYAGTGSRYDSRRPGNYVPYASLGGTPLYAGMMVMERHVMRMKESLKLDKVTALVISDGGDTNGLFYEGHVVGYGGNVSRGHQNVHQHAFVVRDTVTKKNFQFVKRVGTGGYTVPENAVLQMMFDVMRARSGSRNIFMFLIQRASDVRMAASMMKKSGVKERTAHEMETAINNTSQYVLPEGVADCSIVVHTESLKLAENEFAKQNTSGMSTAAIGATFINAQKKAMANRKFVNAVIPFLA